MCHSAIRLRAVGTTSQYEAMLRLNPYLLDTAPLSPMQRDCLKERLSGERVSAIGKRHAISVGRVHTATTKAMRALFKFVLKNPHWHPVYGSYRARMEELTQCNQVPRFTPEPVFWIGENGIHPLQRLADLSKELGEKL